MKKIMKKNEMDIIELIAKILKIFKKKFLLLIIFIVIGVCIGYYINYISKTNYKTSFIASSNFITNTRTNDYIALMNESIKHADEALANKIGIPLKNLENIVSINSISIGESNSPSQYMYAKDKGINEFNCIEITIEAIDTTGLKDFHNNIISYIDNTYFIKSLISDKKEQAEKIIEKINEEILEFDSLQALNFKNPANNVYIVGTHKEIIELMEKKMHYESILNLNSLTFLNTPPPFTPVKNMSLIIVLILSVILSTIAWLFIVFILELIKKVNEYNRNIS